MSAPMNMDSFYSQVGNAEVSKQAARVQVGNHLFGLKWYGSRPTRKYGEAIDADFIVLSSDTAEVGSICSKRFFVMGGGNPEGQQKQLKILLSALIGSEKNDEITAAGKWLHGDDQPGVGLRVKCQAYQPNDQEGQPLVDKKGMPIVNENWSSVPNTPESIQETRNVIAGDAAPAPAVAPVAVPVTAPAPTEPPAQTDFMAKFGIK